MTPTPRHIRLAARIRVKADKYLKIPTPQWIKDLANTTQPTPNRKETTHE